MENTNDSIRTRSKFVDIFKPHHATRILYPSRQLLRAGESQSLCLPRNVQKKYEPHPIVPDAAVISNKNSGNQAVDTDFTTYNTTSLWPDDDIASSGDLLADMEAVTQHVGSTKLRAVLFYDPTEAADSDGQRKVFVRVSRFSKFDRKGGQTHYNKAEYTMPIYHFNETVLQVGRDRSTFPLWAKDMKELIRESSDRAMLHVQQRLAVVGRRLPEHDWKAPRTIAPENAIAKLATVMAKAELSEYNRTLQDVSDHITECSCCTEQFEDAGTADPVKLPCSKRHILCLSCVKNICKTSGLTKVRCPWCAVLLANDSNSHILQPDYLDLSVPFRNDPRFTRYENFERGCADLDAGHVRNDTTKVLISRVRFLFIWDILIHTSPSAERPERLWRDHRYAPEYKIVSAAVRAFHNGWNGESWPVNEICKQLRHMIFYCLAVEWKKGEM